MDQMMINPIEILKLARTCRRNGFIAGIIVAVAVMRLSQK